MGIFGRLSELVIANIHALLDQAENPERMLAHVVREMEEGLAAARQLAATAIAGERRLSRELEQNRSAAEHWQALAVAALNGGREDLAREALARKIEHNDLVQVLQPQWAGAHQTSIDVKAAVRTLEMRIAEARRKQCLLEVWHRAANIHLNIQRSAMAEGRSPFAGFARFEERLIEMEDQLLAEVELGRPGNLEREVTDLIMTKRIERELALLQPHHHEAASCAVEHLASRGP
jgi:phage shock protein A